MKNSRFGEMLEVCYVALIDLCFASFSDSITFSACEIV